MKKLVTLLWRSGSAVAWVLCVGAGCSEPDDDALFGSTAGGPSTGATAAGGGAVGGNATIGGTTDTGGGSGAPGGAETGGDGGVGTGGVGTGGTGGEETGGSGGVETGGTGGVGTGGTGGQLPVVGCTDSSLVPCTSLPVFTGTQQVDGDDTDFGALPCFELTFSNAGSVRVDGDKEGAQYDRTESVRARVAWSDAGLHVFAYVTDPALVPAGSIDEIWNGDGIEVLFHSSANLTGDPQVDGVSHAILSASPALAASVQTSAGSATHTALASDRYRTRVVDDGYVVELQLPWPAGGNPASGSQIGFDFALNSADDSPAGAPDGRDAQAMLYVGSVSDGTPCGEGAAEPWCDDRTWCTPVLQ